MAGEKSDQSSGGGASGGGSFNTSSLADQLTQDDAAVKATQDLLDRVDTLGERSILGEVDNLTGSTLTLAGDHHESGGFTSSLPPDTIAPRANGLFGSKNKFPTEGTVGSVTYRTDDGTTILCGWNNPFLGDNKINYAVGGAHPGRFDCRIACGAGNHAAHMRWVVFPLGPPYSLRQFLARRGVASARGLLGPGGGSVGQALGL